MSIRRLLADPFNKQQVKNLEEGLLIARNIVITKDQSLEILQKDNDLLQAQLRAQEEHIDIQEKELKKKQSLVDTAEEKAESAKNMFKSYKKAKRSNKGKVTDTEMIRECYRHFSGYELTSFHKMKAVFDYIEEYLAECRAKDLDVVWQNLFTQQCWESSKGKKRTKYSLHEAFRKIVDAS